MTVVDASVALKWFVPERGTTEALALLPRVLVAPDLFEAELGNALTKKVRRREISAAQARISFGDSSLLLTLVPSRPLAGAALEIALELHHPLHDCYYLALAEEQASVLVTADSRFAAKLQGTRWAALVAELGESLPDE